MLMFTTAMPSPTSKNSGVAGIFKIDQRASQKFQIARIVNVLEHIQMIAAYAYDFSILVFV